MLHCISSVVGFHGEEWGLDPRFSPLLGFVHHVLQRDTRLACRLLAEIERVEAKLERRAHVAAVTNSGIAALLGARWKRRVDRELINRWLLLE